MPGLPQNTFDASSDRRISSNISVFVSLLLNAPAGPKQPTARQFAVEMPVPFGPVMFKMLTQVSGSESGRNVSGSLIKLNIFQVHSKLRLPLNGPKPAAHGPTAPA